MGEFESWPLPSLGSLLALLVWVGCRTGKKENAETGAGAGADAGRSGATNSGGASKVGCWVGLDVGAGEGPVGLAVVGKEVGGRVVGELVSAAGMGGM